MNATQRELGSRCYRAVGDVRKGGPYVMNSDIPARSRPSDDGLEASFGSIQKQSKQECTHQEPPPQGSCSRSSGCQTCANAAVRACRIRMSWRDTQLVLAHEAAGLGVANVLHLAPPFPKTDTPYGADSPLERNHGCMCRTKTRPSHSFRTLRDC